MSTKHTERNPREPTELTLGELAYLVGIREQVVRRMVHYELIQPDRRTPEWCFRPEVVPRVRRLVRLHYQLEVSWSSMPLVLELLGRIDELEQRIRRED